MRRRFRRAFHSRPLWHLAEAGARHYGEGARRGRFHHQRATGCLSCRSRGERGGVSAEAEKPAASNATLVSGCEVTATSRAWSISRPNARVFQGTRELEKDVAKLDKKLSNPGYLAKAKPEIVERTRRSAGVRREARAGCPADRRAVGEGLPSNFEPACRRISNCIEKRLAVCGALLSLLHA